MADEVEQNPLDIDQMNLDKEWVKHPALMGRWVKESALAQFEFDKAKTQLSLLEADLGHEVRTSPEAFGISKITNESVAVTIKTQPSYRKAVEGVAKARYELELANGMVTALEHRKRALSMLVELWIRDYYSSPRVTNEDSQQQKSDVRSRGRKRREDEKNAITVD